MDKKETGNGQRKGTNCNVFRDKKGRYSRVPKPKPKPTPRTSEFQDCDQMSPELLTAVLVEHARQVEKTLGSDLAMLVGALCDRLEEREERVQGLKESRHKVKLQLSSAKEQIEDQTQAKENVHGQCVRYRKQILSRQHKTLIEKVQAHIRQDRLLSCGQPCE